jgi:CRISPR-associated protein Cas1
MRHLTISDYGSFLGLEGERLVVKQNGSLIKEIALSRLRTISILKSGVSLSSDLIHSCALRGIRIFFLDWRGRTASAVIGQNQHAVVKLRKAQFDLIDNRERCFSIVKQIITSKIRNQRAVVLYFGKYLSKKDSVKSTISIYLSSLDPIIRYIHNDLSFSDNWKNVLFGLEGKTATMYWEVLSKMDLLGIDFQEREGRNANSITNKALNYGYSILLSYVWAAVDNAGLEVYAGLFHTDRPGKPSLVLDLMEEYRAWVVDRAIIKIREKLSTKKNFDFYLKKTISDEIHKTMSTPYSYNKKKIKLENILQRQIYRLAGSIVQSKNYKGYSFKW